MSTKFEFIVWILLLLGIVWMASCIRSTHKRNAEEMQRQHDEFFEEHGFHDRRVNIDRRIGHRDSRDRRKGH